MRLGRDWKFGPVPAGSVCAEQLHSRQHFIRQPFYLTTFARA